MADKGKQFYVFDDKDVLWDEYTRFRPEYPEELYNLIFQQHADLGNNSWTRAADLGCGGGLVTSKLIPRFDHVIASDPMKQYIEDAERNLSQPASEGRVSFLQAKAEELVGIPNQSLDMITMAMAIHWADHKAVVKRAAELLRPGGTLAVWVYGTHAYFIDNEEANKVMEEINEVWTTATYPITNPASGGTLNSRLNCLGFDKESWKSGTRRHHWLSNRSFTMEHIPTDPSLVTEDDVIEDHGNSNSLLAHRADLAYTKGYMHFLLPKHNINERLVKQYERLEKALASTGGSAILAWPVALVIATKK